MIFAPSENECSAQVVLPLLIEAVSGPGLKNGEVMPCYGCVKFLVFFFSSFSFLPSFSVLFVEILSLSKIVSPLHLLVCLCVCSLPLSSCFFF